ncbi:amidohydrolase family protein [Brevibacterium spongiae]|uniref:Amidohydrolase n=1 Tax=Brevibacterium spongiae TaxID=2909672 RepID=A0ABY5SUC9_9MICO|nr:amidohydrolase family protein [Brevibacterium spongiae]UVI36651.1 amidohydrolase [Brevibacterium spongiae]
MFADAGLAWVNGAPVEDATAVLHLLKADVPRRFPHIRFHIAHLGGDLAVLFQRIEDNFADWDAFPSSPQTALRSMWFDAANFYEPALRLALEAYGHGTVMAGSDHPYFQGRSMSVHSTTSAPRRSIPTSSRRSWAATPPNSTGGEHTDRVFRRPPAH